MTISITAHTVLLSSTYLYISVYSWIFENMVNENYSNFTRTRPSKGFLEPDQPENHRKERERRERGREQKKKRLATVFSYYGVPLEIVFERQKKKNTMPSTLTDSY